MKIFNTLSRKKEEFVPLTPGEVKMYVCGPTVYNFIHIGNARPMIVFDTVRRYFEYKGYDVRYVSNFTDVDDKIIKKAIEEGVDADTVSRRYIEECKKDMAAMNVKPATVHPQATQEICGMLEMIQTLIDKNHAMWPGTGPCTSGQVPLRNTESCPIRTWMSFSQDSVKSRSPVRKARKTPMISCSGSLKRKGSLSGSRRGATDVRAGILSAPLCPNATWASRLIFTPAARI